MKILTRAEEYVLLSIWKLQENAYSMKIMEAIFEISGEKWSLGTIYAPLERLEKRGYITSYFSDYTPERGGRKRRIYKITPEGKDALQKIKEVHNTFWERLPNLSFER